MSLDYVRKIVSGNKARFVDSETAVNLDLVYVTDRIIIMGYPAVGVSALYRNRRRDVLKFLTARHGTNFHVWNLCPLYENAYSPESMFNRVSRYPFPDHHPPPLPLLPLAVREMTAWLQGDEERVAIIHCKAGKGRSGTLLCSYMLSLPELPPPPQLDRSYTQKELARRIKEREASKSTAELEAQEGKGSAAPAKTGVPEQRDGWVVIGGGKEVKDVQVDSSSEDDGTHTPAQSERIAVDSPYNSSIPRSTTSSTTTLSHPSPPPSVQIPVSTNPPFDPIDIGDEKKPEQAGQQDRLDGKVDAVFKLHSSRRMKPSSTGRGVSIPSQRRWCRYVHLLFANRAPPAYLNPGTSRVQLTSITILLHPPSGWKKPLASLVVGGSGGSGIGRAWASVARYDDAYVDELRRRGGSGQGVSGEISWGGVGGDGSFDTSKMFRSCGKMVASETETKISDIDGLPADHENFNVHHLIPKLADGSESLILDRGREFRLKFHLASMPLGWTWLIPAFHLPEPPSTSTSSSQTARTHTLVFSRSQLDFAIGPGASVHQVIVRLKDVGEGDVRATAPLLSPEEEVDAGFEDRGGENVKEDGE